MIPKLLEVEGLTTGFRARAGQFVKVLRNVSLSRWGGARHSAWWASPAVARPPLE